MKKYGACFNTLFNMGVISREDASNEYAGGEGVEYELSEFMFMTTQGMSRQESETSLFDSDDEASTMASSYHTYKQIKRLADEFGEDRDTDFAGHAMEAVISATSFVAGWINDNSEVCSGSPTAKFRKKKLLTSGALETHPLASLSFEGVKESVPPYEVAVKPAVGKAGLQDSTPFTIENTHQNNLHSIRKNYPFLPFSNLESDNESERQAIFTDLDEIRPTQFTTEKQHQSNVHSLQQNDPFSSFSNLESDNDSEMQAMFGDPNELKPIHFTTERHRPSDALSAYLMKEQQVETRQDDPLGSYSVAGSDNECERKAMYEDLDQLLVIRDSWSKIEPAEDEEKWQKEYLGEWGDYDIQTTHVEKDEPHTLGTVDGGLDPPPDVTWGSTRSIEETHETASRGDSKNAEIMKKLIIKCWARNEQSMRKKDQTSVRSIQLEPLETFMPAENEFSFGEYDTLTAYSPPKSHLSFEQSFDHSESNWRSVLGDDDNLRLDIFPLKEYSDWDMAVRDPPSPPLESSYERKSPNPFEMPLYELKNDRADLFVTDSQSTVPRRNDGISRSFDFPPSVGSHPKPEVVRYPLLRSHSSEWKTPVRSFSTLESSQFSTSDWQQPSNISGGTYSDSQAKTVDLDHYSNPREETFDWGSPYIPSSSVGGSDFFVNENQQQSTCVVNEVHPLVRSTNSLSGSAIMRHRNYKKILMKKKATRE